MFEKLILVLFLIAWIWGGIKLMQNYQRIFGPHPDDPSESPGARSLGQTQIWSVWIGMIIGVLYFIFR